MNVIIVNEDDHTDEEVMTTDPMIYEVDVDAGQVQPTFQSRIVSGQVKS